MTLALIYANRIQFIMRTSMFNLFLIVYKQTFITNKRVQKNNSQPFNLMVPTIAFIKVFPYFDNNFCTNKYCSLSIPNFYHFLKKPKFNRLSDLDDCQTTTELSVT